jgi:branched-chain amino acid aminotransferase
MNEKHIYEVIRFEKGVALFAEEHLQRLYDSAKQCNININFRIDDIYKKYYDAKLDNTIITNLKIDVYAYGINMSFQEPIKTSKDMYKCGVSVKTVSCERKNPNIKSSEQSYYSRLRDNFTENDIFEFILYDNDILKEGTRSNFFGVKKNIIYTQNNQAVLMGVTRKIILQLANSFKIPVKFEDIYLKNINEMDGFFITGTSIGVLPIKKIDHFTFLSSQNETIIKLQNEYNNYVLNYIYQHRKN